MQTAGKIKLPKLTGKGLNDYSTTPDIKNKSCEPSQNFLICGNKKNNRVSVSTGHPQRVNLTRED